MKYKKLDNYIAFSYSYNSNKINALSSGSLHVESSAISVAHFLGQSNDFYRFPYRRGHDGSSVFKFSDLLPEKHQQHPDQTGGLLHG
jgi:hypothetical protein